MTEAEGPQLLAALETEVRALLRDFHDSTGEPPLFPTDPHVALGLAQSLPQTATPGWREDLRRVVDGCRRNHSPRFWGYVMGSGNAVGVLGEWLAAGLHQNVTSWRSAPAATELEHLTLSWLAELIGWRRPAGAYFVSGGSMANLAALAMARAAAVPDAGGAGVRGAPPLRVYATAEVHVSVPKACDLLGLGKDALRSVAVDGGLRMRPQALAAAITEDRAQGRQPIAVVASAGTTATGAVDPIGDIAAVCRSERLWLHVDGAYGALAAAVRPDLFAGIDAADSVSLDCHKWLCAPLDAGCLLFRDDGPALAAFSHDAAYARPIGGRDSDESFAFFDVGLETSRPFRALKIWLMLRVLGADHFRAVITRNLELARSLVAKLEAAEDFEVLAPVTLSVVCFRHRPPDLIAEMLDAHNERILARSQRRGRIYISNAALPVGFALRACITNAATAEPDLDGLLEEVRACARHEAPGG